MTLSGCFRWARLRLCLAALVGLLGGTMLVATETAPTPAHAVPSATPALDAVAWAKNEMANDPTDYYMRCLPFVADAYASAGVSIGSAADPVTYWGNHAGAQHAGDYSAPEGALVFWGASRYGMEGHVALSLGNGTVISSYERGDPNIHTFGITDRSAKDYPYLGWMMPPGVSPPATEFPAENTIVVVNNGPQYISWRGRALPISYNDAVRYGQESHAGGVPYSGTLPGQVLPSNTVFRPVGSGQQYIWDGYVRQPITNPGISDCLVRVFPQPGIAVVPADWMTATMPVASFNATCTLPDGTLFLENGNNQQYISWRGVSLPISYNDAVRYGQEAYPGATSLSPGYLATHPTASLPVGTVIRPVGQNAQYLWDGSALHLITDPGTSDCLVRYAYPQNGVAVVPADWAATLTVSSTNATCTLPDGLLFGENGSGQQYITWQGVVYALSYSDAVKYAGEGYLPAVWISPGYIYGHPYGVLPANTVIRPVGQNAQYLWDGSALHLITDPAISSCLIAQYQQQSVPDVVPADWAANLSVSSTNATCV